MGDEEIMVYDYSDSNAQAIKACGAIVSLEPDAFTKLLSETKNSLVVMAVGGWRKHNYHYLSAYKGLIFYTKSKVELSFPGNTELMTSKNIWIPS